MKPEGYSLTSQTLYLFLKNYQFKCHKPHDH